MNTINAKYDDLDIREGSEGLPSEIKTRKPRLLIFIIAYNAEKTIQGVLLRIPKILIEEYQVESLIIDNASSDQTFETAHAIKISDLVPFRLHVLSNLKNQSYGGNQKLGYHFAIQNGFDFIAFLHGDGQFAPECLPDLVRPLYEDKADGVFGSRMTNGKNALKGGIPIYKFVVNRILTKFENWMLQTKLSEFYFGCRVYSVAALEKIPWHLNTNEFHFDTEIIIQFIFAQLRILEIPISTYYGEEICHVNTLKNALNVARAILRARAQELCLFYDRRFDCFSGDRSNIHYHLKDHFTSPHSICLEKIPKGSLVLDLGCAGGYVGAQLKKKMSCIVYGADVCPLAPNIELDGFQLCNLNTDLMKIDFSKFNYVLLLDVIEHLASPENFVDTLRIALKQRPDIKLLVSTANVGFLITRIMLLFGQYNYGKRGILDITHTRLFFPQSFRRLFEQAGFRVTELKGIPAPFPLIFGDGKVGKLLLWLNSALIRLSRNLFSYQIFMTVSPLPSLEYLLSQAYQKSTQRVGLIETKSFNQDK